MVRVVVVVAAVDVVVVSKCLNVKLNAPVVHSHWSDDMATFDAMLHKSRQNTGCLLNVKVNVSVDNITIY